ncbi:hypothetical protein [Pseudofrankia asymbiotica]|uniref:Uncharacterized protein n=1 Tax=Pseudofrankia asymbiotica TaxID=1834516 RepID=A0A1V2I4J7_9ACTN|nr:hypothetical protein [Pseudofrankia asymbiotica]ONH25510.1 hypothetical protein BL253_27270 [Pseudofrankia asymbiotica]
MISPAPFSYTSVRLTLRPSRVIIVIDGGEHWSYWARRALYRASRIWGGGGFVVVPHREGKVDPILLSACQAYDPDFVVTYSPTVEDREHFTPGWFQAAAEGGALLKAEERDRAFESMRNDEIDSESDEAARDEIAKVCSVYGIGGEDVTSIGEEFMSIGDEAAGHFVDIEDVPGTWSGAVLGCPSGWGGLVGAAVALQAGVAEPPLRDAVEPNLDDETLIRLIDRLFGSGLAAAGAPDELVWYPGVAGGIDTRTATSAHERTMSHIEPILTGTGYGRSGLLVLGDEPEDFALAGLWQQTFGVACWLPSALGFDRGELPWALGYGVAHLAQTLRRSRDGLTVTSISQTADELAAARERLMAPNPIISVSWPDKKIAGDDDRKSMPRRPPLRTEPLKVIPAPELSWQQPTSVALAIRDQWDSAVTVPVTVDRTGTTVMAAPLPPPVLTSPELSTVPSLNWHVDVRWAAGRAVRRRDVAGHELLAEPTPFPSASVRSSRDGVSYQAAQVDLVAVGIRPENKLARPALRDLSLESWIAAKCRQQGIIAQRSDAGRRAALLASMLGGRREYVELFGGSLLPGLRAMFPTSARSDEAYPDEEGVAMSRAEGVLTFVGMCSRVPAVAAEGVRERLDAALRSGVLRRGLVLECATCGRKQFQTVDRIGQRWICLRCDAGNDLDAPAWRAPLAEPKWFYDLHPAGREVLHQNGDTVALLSAYLRRQAKTGARFFDDVEEVELKSADGPEVELDLVTYSDDVLTIAECKSSADKMVGKAGRREVAKKCDAAARLRVDRLLFATEKPVWSEGAGRLVANVVTGFPGWGPLRRPQLIMVSGLGTDAVQEIEL